MNKLLLVDGSNLLFQMFYGMPARILNSKGKPMQGVLGFVGALLKIIRKTDPTHILVLFDGEHSNPRTELSKTYKANRMDYTAVPEEDNPFSQLDDIYKALQHLQIPFYETTHYEADDIIAAYVHTLKNIPIIISSWDSDLFSLISDHTSIFRYRGDNSYVCDKAYVWNRLQIQPSQYKFFKALCGDTADNIKGIKGIGPKSAAYLVNKYNSIQELYDNLENEKLKKLLFGQKTVLELNYKLIDFIEADSLPYALEHLVYTLHQEVTTKSILTKIGAY